MVQCMYFQWIDSAPPTAMFILYTVAPLLYRLASSAYFNLSLLSSDFYGLLFGMMHGHLIFKFSVDTCAVLRHRSFPLRALSSCIMLFSTFLSTILEKHFEPYWLYFPSFAVVIVGLIVYFWHSTRTSLEMPFLLS